MTSVDQAFLKAFARPATPRPNLAAQRRVTLAAAIEARAKAVEEHETPEDAATVPMAATAVAPLREAIDEHAHIAAVEVAIESPASNSIAQALAVRLERITAEADAPAVLPMPPAATATEETTPPEDVVTADADTLSEAEPAEPILRLLRPALRLERFPWPASAARLNKAHAARLDGIIGALAAAQQDGTKVVGLIAHGRGEGASTVTLAIARRLSDGKLRVAVADGDWNHPQLARRLALLSEGGWEAVLAGRRTLAEAMVEAGDGRLAVLPCVAAPTVKDDAALDEIFDTLRQNYDLIFVDLPPGNEAATLLPKLDAAVIVQHTDKTGETEVAAVEKQLAAAGVAVLGVVQNCVNE